MPPYDKYIEGNYYPSFKFAESLTDKKREILDVLRHGYPNALSAKDLQRYAKDIGQYDKDHKQYYIPENTAHQYLDPLARVQLIGKIREKDKKTHREVTKYYFEDYNYILSKTKDFSLPLAPGYVQYTNGFLDIYNRARDTEYEEKIFNQIIDYLKIVFQKAHRKAKPHEIKGGCGYDHETRDFIRAVLLYMMDELEMNNRFIEFIRENQVITEAKYKDLIKIAEEEDEKRLIHHIKDHFTPKR